MLLFIIARSASGVGLGILRVYWDLGVPLRWGRLGETLKGLGVAMGNLGLIGRIVRWFGVGRSVLEDSRAGLGGRGGRG